jgi:phosphoglycolate phosphatase-like HAD superfamily hydrolase
MDGVILNSLDKLSKCLIEAIKPFCQSDNQFREFARFDETNPGLSRFEKADYFVNHLLSSNHLSTERVKVEILQKFHSLSLEARLNSEIEDSLYDLPKTIPPTNLILLSNCDNEQLKIIDVNFGFHRIFRAGIVGTPPSKKDRFSEIIQAFNRSDIVSVSDSESDAVIAREFGAKFAFIQRFARDTAPWLSSDEFRFSTIGEFQSNII